MIDSVFEGLCHRVWKFLQYEAMKVMSESSLHDNFRQSTNYQALVNFLIPKVLPSCIFSLSSFLTSIVTILRWHLIIFHIQSHQNSESVRKRFEESSVCEEASYVYILIRLKCNNSDIKLLIKIFFFREHIYETSFSEYIAHYDYYTDVLKKICSSFITFVNRPVGQFPWTVLSYVRSWSTRRPREI